MAATVKLTFLFSNTSFYQYDDDYKQHFIDTSSPESFFEYLKLRELINYVFVCLFDQVNIVSI